MPPAVAEIFTKEHSYREPREGTSTSVAGSVRAEGENVLATGGKVVAWLSGYLFAAASTQLSKVHYPQKSNNKIVDLLDEVGEIYRTVGPDWNGYGSEGPNELSRDIAQMILLSSGNVIVPNRVAPSAQGGIGICFYRGQKYADIECLNTGEILATISDGTSRPDVWVVKPSESKGALERIGQYIAS
jgi:hypothetical protein